jgi:hypothetical protein
VAVNTNTFLTLKKTKLIIRLAVWEFHRVLTGKASGAELATVPAFGITRSLEQPFDREVPQGIRSDVAVDLFDTVG